MKVRVVTPAPPGSTAGNRVTAQRWARILCTLGHRVRVATDYQSEDCDVLVALHARKSADAAARFKSRYPDAPLIVCLTGTDLHNDIHRDRAARRTLALATCLVVLYPGAEEQLPDSLKSKLRVIYQSAMKPQKRYHRDEKHFDVCVLAHLRYVKDPLRAAMASRHLPRTSRIRITQVGAALSDVMERSALAEHVRNPRFAWMGEQSRAHTLRILATSDALVLSSRSEGGANVISEAVMATVPILASKIVSSVDLLGRDYPGFFSVGNTAELRALMYRAETDRIFYDDLRGRVTRLADLFRPGRERESWRRLLDEVS